MRRLAVTLPVLGLVLTACSGMAAPTTTSDGLPPASSTTTSAPAPISTTTTMGQPELEGRVGLYSFDPTTLEPTGARPITTGDWITGASSPNAQWLVLTVWLDTQPETDLIRIINVPEGEVVAEATMLVPTAAVVADDGTAYWTQGSMAPFYRLYSLAPGGDSAVLIFDEFPVGFEVWSEPTIIDNNRIGWFGMFGPQTDEDAPGLVVLDLESLTTTTFLVPDVHTGAGEELDFGQTKVVEWFSPEVVWDGARDRVYVVHADRDAFTVVDLSTGETDTRTWAPPTSWLGRLFTWLIPPAQAKGPSLGTRRSVALSPDGETLFVGTTSSHIETEEDTRLSAVWQPEGVIALDSQTGGVLKSWIIPASDVYISPSGDHLVVLGMTIRDSLGTSSYVNEGAYLIDVASGNVVRHLAETDENGGRVQFSAQGDVAYLTDYEGKVEVVDLDSGDIITEIVGSQETTVFGQAGLISTRH